MRLVIPEPSPLDTESDAELLLIGAAGDENERRQATNAFFRRYARQLYGFCRQSQRTLGGAEVVDDLVIMTFQRAFKRADSYNSDGIVDPEHSRARTFRWLTTIAKNLMRDWLRSSSEHHPPALTSIAKPDRQIEGQFARAAEEAKPRRYARLPDDAVEKIHDPTAIQKFIGNDDESPLTISPEGKCLQEALATLAEREREILLLSAQYSIDGKQLRLPPDVLNGLCARWETTKMNVRKIRMRARNKVEEYMATHC